MRLHCCSVRLLRLAASSCWPCTPASTNNELELQAQGLGGPSRGGSADIRARTTKPDTPRPATA